MASLNRVTKLIRAKQVGTRGAELRAKAEYTTGELYEIKSIAEGSFGQVEKAEEAAGQANAAFFRLFVLSDPTKEGARPWMEKGFMKVIPYEIQAKRFEDIVEYCETRCPLRVS